MARTLVVAPLDVDALERHLVPGLGVGGLEHLPEAPLSDAAAADVAGLSAGEAPGAHGACCGAYSIARSGTGAGGGGEGGGGGRGGGGRLHPSW
jgi:hypothetical protein